MKDTNGTAKFPLGQTVMTANAQRQLPIEEVMVGLDCHVRGDWGQLDDDDKNSNDSALEQGGRILSAYHTSSGIKFWIITEWDRSVTTVLLPEDY
jgi:hypothetical protein